MEEGALLITRQDLSRIGITYSNTHLLYLERIGAFPRRIRLSPQKVAWHNREITEWMNNRSSQREAAK